MSQKHTRFKNSSPFAVPYLTAFAIQRGWRWTDFIEKFGTYFRCNLWRPYHLKIVVVELRTQKLLSYHLPMVAPGPGSSYGVTIGKSEKKSQKQNLTGKKSGIPFCSRMSLISSHLAPAWQTRSESASVNGVRSKLNMWETANHVYPVSCPCLRNAQSQQ